MKLSIKSREVLEVELELRGWYKEEDGYSYGNSDRSGTKYLNGTMLNIHTGESTETYVIHPNGDASAFGWTWPSYAFIIS